MQSLGKEGMCSGGCWGINQFGGDVGKIAAGKSGGNPVGTTLSLLPSSESRQGCMPGLLAASIRCTPGAEAGSRVHLCSSQGYREPSHISVLLQPSLVVGSPR